MTKKDLFSYVNAFVVGILLFSSVALAQQDFRGNAVPAETVLPMEGYTQSIGKIPSRKLWPSKTENS
jgi:hypothetical protein